MTTKKDDWKAILDGDDYAEAGLARPVSLKDFELLTRVLYDKATLEFPMNETPAAVAEAAREMLRASNAAIKATVALAERVRASLAERDGPFPEPVTPEAQAAALADLAARSAHRPQT